MEWRCAWCGKPHENDDPPCDNCGHGKFEEAVVRRTDLAEDGPEATLVWVCTECGREHPKHAPPCSRCGNTTLEKQNQRVDDSELTAPGYLDLVTPRYLAALGLTLAVAAVLVLGFAGVLDLPGFDGGGVPDVDGVPGDAEAAGGVDLADVEDAYVAALNDRLDAPELERSERLDEVTTFYHQQLIRWQLADGPPPDDEQTTELLFEECRSGTPIEFEPVGLSHEGDDATALGEALAAELVDERGWRPATSRGMIGVDAHAVDGELHLGQFVCER